MQIELQNILISSYKAGSGNTAGGADRFEFTPPLGSDKGSIAQPTIRPMTPEVGTGAGDGAASILDGTSNTMMFAGQETAKFYDAGSPYLNHIAGAVMCGGEEEEPQMLAAHHHLSDTIEIDSFSWGETNTGVF